MDKTVKIRVTPSHVKISSSHLKSVLPEKEVMAFKKEFTPQFFNWMWRIPIAKRAKLAQFFKSRGYRIVREEQKESPTPARPAPVVRKMAAPKRKQDGATCPEGHIRNPAGEQHQCKSCMGFSKKELQEYARLLDLRTQGTKETLCKQFAPFAAEFDRIIEEARLAKVSETQLRMRKQLPPGRAPPPKPRKTQGRPLVLAKTEAPPGFNPAVYEKEIARAARMGFTQLEAALYCCHKPSEKTGQVANKIWTLLRRPNTSATDADARVTVWGPAAGSFRITQGVGKGKSDDAFIKEKRSKGYIDNIPVRESTETAIEMA